MQWELWKLWSAICVVCDVPYQLIRIWAFSRKRDIKLQSVIINTADPTVNQGEKMNLWGTKCFSLSVVVTLLEHVISFSNFPIGTYWFATLVCWKRNTSILWLGSDWFSQISCNFYSEWIMYVLTSLRGSSSGISEHKFPTTSNNAATIAASILVAAGGPGAASTQAFPSWLSPGLPWFHHTGTKTALFLFFLVETK